MDAEIEKMATDVLNAAFEIHTEFGPGLLERVYLMLLVGKLKRMGYSVEQEVPITFSYEGEVFHDAFRVDILVEKRLVVELKSVEVMLPVFAKQLLTYLRLMDLRLGLLINFGSAHLKDGIKRIVN
ncbi:MAG: GxxExxY protein [Lentisphaerae bacterium]|jgi:iron complex transport system substrate-binding protein|nr:GxxExxY protein [Kiritimatiellia bacterium]MDD4442368.1 GxxExxY protein [Kiritimatiellia bacterium]MDX9795102.1 GxxExxY protein [Kiritimatiellia bacterium]NLC83027.1 GxxExxY protein [Lentisphaerota bacterium]